MAGKASGGSGCVIAGVLLGLGAVLLGALAALALWSARAGVAALMRGLNAIHHLPNRSGHLHQLRALVLTFVLVGMVLSAMTIAVILPLIVAYLPDIAQRFALAETNLALGIVAGVLAVGLAYRLGPNYTTSRTPLLSWGLLVAVVLWFFATRSFMLYLANFPSYNRVYGSIGAVIAMLVWLWLSSFVILLGAVVNAQVEKHIYGVETPDGASPFEELPEVPADAIVDTTPENSLP